MIVRSDMIAPRSACRSSTMIERSDMIAPRSARRQGDTSGLPVRVTGYTLVYAAHDGATAPERHHPDW